MEDDGPTGSACRVCSFCVTTEQAVQRIFLRDDLVGEADRHRPATKRFERELPNELWQMDFKGPKNWPHPIGPLSVIDDKSRYLIRLAITGGLIKQQLELAFDVPKQNVNHVPKLDCEGPGVPSAWTGIFTGTDGTRPVTTHCAERLSRIGFRN